MKKNMDERELMEMYKIEHYMFWFTFWTLFVSLMIQIVFCGRNSIQVAGEFFVFMAMAIVSSIMYIRKGIYDTWSQPGLKSYLAYSIIFSILTTVILTARNYYLGYITEMKNIVLIAVFHFGAMFVFLFIIMFLLGEVVKKRRKKLADKYENND